eukprot:scaffold78503_cov63-Phaeocystis_antarctica.AAC.4
MQGAIIAAIDSPSNSPATFPRTSCAQCLTAAGPARLLHVFLLATSEASTTTSADCDSASWRSAVGRKSRSVRDAKPARTVAAGQVVEVAADAMSAPKRMSATAAAEGATSTFSRGVAPRAFGGVHRAIGNRACATSALALSVLSSKSKPSARLPLIIRIRLDGKGDRQRTGRK